MIPPRRIAAAALCAAIVALPMSACGGSGDESRPPAETSAPPRVLARANANCRDFRRETVRIGEGALANPASTSTLELTTERLVKPSIPLLERIADRQQALEPAAHDPQFDLYANLFDPVIVLAQQRLSAGEAGDPIQSKGLEEMLTDLGLEQMRVARAVGLRDCDLDFQHILLSSLSE